VNPETAFEEIKKNALRLRRLANDILDVSRIEGGRLNLAKDEVKINDFISDFVNTSRVSLNNDITIELRMTTPDDLSVLADRTRLNQVLSNIVGNAVKFTKQGIIMVETNIVEFGKQVEIVITDDGPGIHKDILPKLFDKFASRNGHNSGNEGGTGLGLYLSRAIIEAHGGSVSAYNNKVKGASFKIILPTYQALNQDEAKEVNASKNSLLSTNSLLQLE
jgi:signal transduction histidine kinase